MTDAEKMIMSDAIETAVRAERKACILEKVVVALGILCGVLIYRRK